MTERFEVIRFFFQLYAPLHEKKLLLSFRSRCSTSESPSKSFRLSDKGLDGLDGLTVTLLLSCFHNFLLFTFYFLHLNLSYFPFFPLLFLSFPLPCSSSPPFSFSHFWEPKKIMGPLVPWSAIFSIPGHQQPGCWGSLL